MLLARTDRGDTIIEVLFAITVFSLVAVGGLSLMNQGTGIAQRALEIGLVRQQIDAQTDALRYLNSAYIEGFQKDPTTGGVKTTTSTTVWDAVVTNHREAQSQDFDGVALADGCHMPGSTYHPFAIDITKLDDALNPDTSQAALSSLVLVPATKNTLTYAKVANNPLPEAEGIWIEAVQATANSGFYDFHVTACWTSPGQEVPVKLGTIVRLYVPQA
ncbi:MAG: exported protein of unknown function [Candidatus Saccharibacteria bacterium]|nr:exported protein of unknown function [Candidatus Saccharibacteria bacterium]